MNSGLRMMIIFAVLLAPARVRAWGDDGHVLVLRLALGALPPATRAAYDGMERDLERACLEPDKHGAVPMESCKHWLDIEKLDPDVLRMLRDALHRQYGREGYADEDARGFAGGVEKDAFERSSPPWPVARVAPLFAALPPTLGEFRARYGRLEFLVGTVVYQPVIYTRALARALKARDRRRILGAAGGLAHYVADLHVPLHVTSDFKGRYSGNPGFEGREIGDVHARFETAYVNADLAALEAAARATLTAPPAAMAAAAITPRAVNAARRAYALVAPILAADRAAARLHDPRRNRERWLAAVRPAFAGPAGEQLGAAAAFLADCLVTASTGNQLAPPQGSDKMESP